MAFVFEWKKIMVTNIFFFSHNVFLSRFLKVIKIKGCVINPFSNKPWFLRVCSKSLLKTLWENEKLLATSNFSFSHSVFYPFRDLSAIFIKLKNCRLQTLSFLKSLKFVVWESDEDGERSITVS